MENSSIKRVNQKDLTDDVWFEIFLRLPLDSIFKFRSVSKVWLLILSSPNFISKWYELNSTSLPWGLIHYNNPVREDSLRELFTIAYPELHSPFIENHENRFSLSFLEPFIPNRNDPIGTNLYIIGSSNGLVLCSPDLVNPTTYYVCNPLTKKWVSFPPPPPTAYNRVVTGFVCNGCFSESTSCYKVIRIPKFEAATKEFKAEIFSSRLGEWNVYDVSCAEDVTWEGSFYDNYATHNGVFYWFQKGNSKILAIGMNVSTNHRTSGNNCRLINLPHQSVDDNLKLHHHLGESEGLICYAILSESERSLSVWVLKEDWCLLYKDNKFHYILSEMETLLIGGACTDLIKQPQVLGFNPVDRNVVILFYKKHIWGYNVRTKGYVRLCHPFFLRNKPSFFFVSSLAIGFTPRPTILPPLSWRDASILDAQILELKGYFYRLLGMAHAHPSWILK